MKTIEDIKAVSLKHPVMLFDGECIFCCNALQFFIKIDKEEKLRYTTLQSEVGQALREQLGLNQENESVILVDQNEIYTETDVTFQTLRHLRFPWKALAILRFIPRPIRNFIYKIIAKNRYKWFGRKDQCMIPATSQKHLFL